MEFIFGGGGDLFGGYFMVSIIVQGLWLSENMEGPNNNTLM